ncbi:MAG: hypothetical protein QM784_38905 [Polyangiaceae bacterium]
MYIAQFPGNVIESVLDYTESAARADDIANALAAVATVAACPHRSSVCRSRDSLDQDAASCPFCPKRAAKLPSISNTTSYFARQLR